MKNFIRFVGLCLLMLVVSPIWFAACASGGGKAASAGSATEKRGLTVEKLPGSKTDIEVYPQLGHTNVVDSVTYSPDGKYIVSSGLSIKIWDVESCRELLTLFGHTRSISAVAYSPDGKHIVSGSYDKTLKIWDAKNGQELQTLLGHTDTVYCVAYSPDGKRIVSGSRDMTLRIWDAENGTLIRTFSGQRSWVWSVAYSPDGRFIVAGFYDNTIRIYNAENGQELLVLSGHSGNGIHSVAFSPDGKHIVSGGNDNTVRIWDAKSGRVFQILSGNGISSFHSARYSNDGKYIVACAFESIYLWDAESGRELRTILGHNDTVKTVAFSPDGLYIASGSSDRTIRIWNIENGLELRRLSGTSSKVNAVMFSSDGKRIVSGSADFKIRIWNAENGSQLQTLSGPNVTVESVVFSPDGKRIVSTFGYENSYTAKPSMRLWDVESGKELRTFLGHKGFIKSIAFSPDGKRIVSGSSLLGIEKDYTVRIWNAESGQELRILSGHTSPVQSVAFSPDGKYIASGSGDISFPIGSDNTVRIWDVESGRELRKFSGHACYIKSVAFSPDGKRIVSGSATPTDWATIDNTVRIWDVESGKELRKLVGHTDGLESVAYSPDGKHIVSGSRDKTIRIWDAESGRDLRKLSGHTAAVKSVTFNIDGNQILSCSEDGTIRLWDTSTGKELTRYIPFSGSDTQLASASRGLTVETETTAISNDGEWLSITPDGYYQASPRGDRYLNVRVNNTVSGIDSYRSIFYNPDVVQARLQGRPDPASKANVTIQQAASFIPPTVTIKSPANFSATNTATTNLAVAITSQSQPVKNIKIIVNGRLIGKDELAAVKGTSLQPERASLTVTGNQKTVNLSLPLELEPGNNRIEVVAFNGYSESRRFIDVTRNAPAGEKPPLPNLWIVAVGVNGYDNAGPKLQGLTNLNFAVADAKGLVDSLKAQEGKRYAKVNSMLIADGEDQVPTTANIRQGLKFLEGADPRRDIVILFLAGHGISAQESKFFFLPKDAVFSGNRVVDASRAISGDEIMSVLDAPGNRLVFIDACQSGGVDNDRMVRSLMDTNAFVFTASRGNELSYESGELGHGFFTYSVMSALKGAPAALAQGNVSVLSMSGFVKDDVPKKTGGRQNPSAYSLGFYDFPVAVINAPR